MNSKSINRVAAVLTALVGGVLACAGLAQANGPGANGLVRVEESNVRVDDRIRIKEKEGAQVIVSHIKIQPGGHTPWHYHPGPHIVSVKTGTVTVYETDCSPTSYAAGTGFFDPGSVKKPHIHTLRNTSDQIAEVVITDIRTEDLRPTVVADPEPPACFR